MTRWNAITFQGETMRYEYKDSWGRRYYSFDNEQTWFTSKKRAYEQAKATGSLRIMPAVDVQRFRAQLHMA